MENIVNVLNKIYTAILNVSTSIHHHILLGLTDDDHSQYPLLAGRAGGQTFIGGSAVTDILKLQGTSGNGTAASPALQSLVGNNGATVALTILNDGNVGIGITAPTAILHLKAGTATANTGPLKFTTGTVLTTPEAGVMEYNNTPHFTNSDAARRHIVLAPSTTKITAAAPYANDGYIIMNIGGTDFKIMTTA